MFTSAQIGGSARRGVPEAKPMIGRLPRTHIHVSSILTEPSPASIARTRANLDPMGTCETVIELVPLFRDTINDARSRNNPMTACEF
jgi:hypothetical protein